MKEMTYTWDIQTHTGQSAIEDLKRAYKQYITICEKTIPIRVFHSYRTYKRIIKKCPQLFPFSMKELRRYNRDTHIICEYFGIIYYVTPKLGR